MDDHQATSGPKADAGASSPVPSRGHDPSDARPAPVREEHDWGRLVELGDVHLSADSGSTAIEYYERARSLLAADAWIEQVHVALKIAECLRKRGQQKEAALDLERLLEQVDGRLDRVEIARVRARLGRLQMGLGRYVDAQLHCTTAYEILRETNSNEEIGFLEVTLGTIASRFGQVARAREHFESALFTFRRIDHREGIAQSLNNLGLLLKNGARWSEAREYLERALSVSEEAGNYFRIAATSLNLGILHARRVEWTISQQHLSRALHVFREIGSVSGQTKALLALGNLYLRLRRDRLAERHYQQALELAEPQGYQREIVLAYEFIGELRLRQSRYGEADAALATAHRLALRVAPEGDLVSEVLRRQAEVALARGDAPRAIERALESIAIAERVGDLVEAGISLRIYGEAILETGRLESAQVVLEHAVSILAETPDVLATLCARRARARLLEMKCRFHPDDAAARAWHREAVLTLEEVAARFTELDLSELSLEAMLELAGDRAAAGELDEAFATVAAGLDLAERRALSDWFVRLEAARTALEERFAEASLTRSTEYRLVQDLSGFGPDGSLEAGVKLALERSQSDRAFVAWAGPDGAPRIEAALGFSVGAEARGTRESRDRVIADRDTRAAIEGVVERLLSEFRNGRKVFVSHAPAIDPRLVGGPTSLRDASAAVAIPLPLGGDGGFGLLYLDRGQGHPAGPYRNPDLRLLSLFAGLLSVFLVGEIRARAGADRKARGETTGDEADPYVDFVTCSTELRRAISLLRKLRDSDVGILITGETGTGKGLLARLVHQASRRHAGPFVPINCAALPETLLESELFGHVQGAFTGAVRQKRGLFEEAVGGTLFLDEVDRAPLGVQAKLLHVLDQHEIRPLGGTRWHSVDVRVICATNADLRRAIQEGRFLEDLYYRLNDFPVHISPLRERREDVPLLLRRFYQQFCRELGRAPLGITREAMQLLTDHEWRGNVRELAKVIKRMIVLAEEGERLDVDALPREILESSQHDGGAARGTLRSEIQRLESRMIREALETARGNKSEAARQLHLSYPSLLAKIRQYGLDGRQAIEGRIGTERRGDSTPRVRSER